MDSKLFKGSTIKYIQFYIIQYEIKLSLKFTSLRTKKDMDPEDDDGVIILSETQQGYKLQESENDK